MAAARSMWNIRLRHEWLRQPHKRVHLKRRKRIRCGLEAVLERRRVLALAAAAEADKT